MERKLRKCFVVTEKVINFVALKLIINKQRRYIMNDKFYSVYNELEDKATHTKNKLLAKTTYKGIEKGYLSVIENGIERIICSK